MRIERAVSAFLFVVIAVVVAQGFAWPQAATCAPRDLFGASSGPDCAARYVSVFTAFAGATLGWVLVLAGLRVLGSRITGTTGERRQWMVLGWLVIAAALFLIKGAPFREVLLVAAIPALTIGLQESAWRFEPSLGPRKPLLAGFAWALVVGASAFLVTGALLQGSPVLSRIWWTAVVQFGDPGEAFAGPAFFGGAIVALIVYLLKPTTGIRTQPDSQAALVIFVGMAVFGFSVPVWLWSVLASLPDDPFAGWVARAFQTPSTLALIGVATGLSALVGSLARFRSSRGETLALLIITAPVLSIAADRFAHEWLAVSGSYPFTGEMPHFTAVAILSASRVLWVYPLLGYFLAVRALRPSWVARWMPSIPGLLLALLLVATTWLSFHTEIYERFRFYIDSFRLKEDLALLGVPLIATGWLLPALRFRTPRLPANRQAPSDATT